MLKQLSLYVDRGFFYAPNISKNNQKERKKEQSQPDAVGPPSGEMTNSYLWKLCSWKQNVAEQNNLMKFEPLIVLNSAEKYHFHQQSQAHTHTHVYAQSYVEIPRCRNLITDQRSWIRFLELRKKNKIIEKWLRIVDVQNKLHQSLKIN